MGEEGRLLRKLVWGELAAEDLERILRDPSTRKLHAVRLALVRHPRTPRRDALSLVSTLFWRDLAVVSSDVRVHPELRRAADRDLLRRLPDLALAERIDLARCAGRGALAVLRLDPDPRVLAAVMDNRFTIEIDVIAAASRREAGMAALDLIATHPRWSLRPAVRAALLRNRSIPEPLALTLLSRASADDLIGLQQAPGVSRLLKACAETVLAQRSGGV